MNFLKKKFQRTCIGCKEKKYKNEFYRIVKDKQNNIKIDLSGKAEGRGAYLCKDINCFEKAKKNKRLAHSFKMKIDDMVWLELRGVFVDK